MITWRTRRPRPDRPDRIRVATCVALAVWFWTIVAGNAPIRGLDAVRKGAGRADLWLPDWRFFAPVPPDHDLVLEYRTRDRAGRTGPWHALDTVRGRRWWNVIVSPGARRAQAYKQVARHLRSRSPHGPEERRLARFVRREVARVPDAAVAEFSFRIVRTAAHDDTVPPRTVVESGWMSFDEDEVSRRITAT